MSSNLTSPLSRLLLLLAAGVLASCGGSSLTSTGGSVGSGSGSGSGSGGGDQLLFSMGDLNGDWTGELIPDDRQLIRKNLYLRIANGAITEAAEGAGGEWTPADSTLLLEFTDQGFLDVSAQSLSGKGDLSLEGTMNVALNTINGTVRVLSGSGVLFEGTFELRRSSGPGHFSVDLVQGAWEGNGNNESERFRITTMEVDDFGVVQAAELVRPASLEIEHTYSAGSGVLELADDAIGRMNNVVLVADDGSTLTFEFLLINDLGTLITGPGEDSVLGKGRVELVQ
ncbi:MAG: hypothetical protein ACYSU1_01100 [Planctomycetota bacterium]|jgi:hypothetical protein